MRRLSRNKYCICWASKAFDLATSDKRIADELGRYGSTWTETGTRHRERGQRNYSLLFGADFTLKTA